MNSISVWNVRIKIALGLVAILTLSVAQPCPAGTPAPPPAFSGLYNTLNGDLGAFNTTLNGLWNGSRYPVAFGANLANGNANVGPSLVSGGGGVTLELQAYKAMGVQAILVQVGFPVLYQPFYTYLSTQPGYQTLTYSQFATYYQQLAQTIRAAGFQKIIVENDVLLANDVANGWGAVVGQYYATLNWAQFQAARAQNALAVAQLMQPDYLVVLEEPQSQATQTGQTNINTVSGAASMVNQILTALQPVRSTMKVGAGMATDQTGYQGFAQSFANVQCSVSQPCVTGLDFVDMHIYPINNLGPTQNFLQNALTIATIAASGGKPVAITEAWMWKMRDNEWTALPFDTIRGRNPFSFWAPLDAYFLQTMENLANYTQMLFIAPEGPYYLFAYQTYDSTTKNLPPAQLLSQELMLAGQANQNAVYSSTGISYYNSLVQPPDTIPPSTPVILTSSSGSPSTVSLSWAPSTDNVGVAGYYLWRCSSYSPSGCIPKQLPTTALTMFQDSGLMGNTPYTYYVAAFDLGGNVSPQASVTITTQNANPPNPPTDLTAVALSGQEVSLTWNPPPGNVPVSSYLLFRGSSPTTLVQIRQLYASDTSFTNGHLTPGTTYYYGMEAKANNNLVSPMSKIVAVTTPTNPPDPPRDLTAVALSSHEVSLTWNPPLGNVPVSSYLLFRGSSPTNLVLIQQLYASDTSFNNGYLTPGTTYYYGMEAKANNNLVSPMSNIVGVTTPK